MAFLLFVAMAVSVNDEQDKNNQAHDQKHDQDRLILPDRLHKTGGVGIQAPALYTRSRQNLIRRAIGPGFFFGIAFFAATRRAASFKLNRHGRQRQWDEHPSQVRVKNSNAVFQANQSRETNGLPLM
ncbi:MAG TPA: hypothetical protein VNN22_07125 [Verrucomicrobiae bacterium]|nr:hypothetical protein [Verrucomicrobiae bacterium]